MANLVITNACNQRCSYCFADAYLQNNERPSTCLSQSGFNKYLDYLDRSKIDQVRLLGGEPTLHPKFGQFVKMSIQRKKSILVFSNGLMPESALQTILEVPKDQIKVLVNVTPTTNQENVETKHRQVEVISQLESRAFLGFTLFDLDPDLLFPILEVVHNTNCRRSIRLGISQPSPYGNVSISPKHYRRIGMLVMNFIKAAFESKIQIELDCGFVRCMFSESDIQDMKTMNVIHGWHCTPIIDLLEDESAIACFPLSDGFTVKNAMDYSENELIHLFVENEKHLRVVGVFAECSTCSYRIHDSCSAGCLSAAIHRMHKKPGSYYFPE